MNTKIILSVFFFFIVSLTLLNGISAYTFKIPVCNDTVNTSCINYTAITPITNAPINSVMFFRDGNLYLTNDTTFTYTIVNNITNITQNITNIYSYNATNGSDITVVQNITANESIIRDWVVTKLTTTFSNMTFYNKSEADNLFAFKTEMNNVKTEITNMLLSYPSITDMNNKYGYLLVINTSGANGTIQLTEDVGSGMGMTWKVIIIINIVISVLLMIVIVKIMMDNN
jgi:hypothetical protein